MREALRAEITRTSPQIDDAARKRILEAEDAGARVEAVKAVPGLDALMASDALDARLAKLFILQDGTPASLAAYARQGATQKRRIDALLADDALMLQIAVAGGARPVPAGRARSGVGEQGKAMEIYTAIQGASEKAREGVLQRLALAVSLGLSEPIHPPEPDAPSDAPRKIDPVERYLHFEKAYEAGELDPSFDRFSTWELRFVASATESDEALAWGREMLRNYRPDLRASRVLHAGTITLPAAACRKPSGNTSEVVAMQSFAGGLQVFLPSFDQQKPVLVRGGSWYHEAPLNASATRHWNGRRAERGRVGMCRPCRHRHVLALPRRSLEARRGCRVRGQGRGGLPSGGRRVALGSGAARFAPPLLRSPRRPACRQPRRWIASTASGLTSALVSPGSWPR